MRGPARRANRKVPGRRVSAAEDKELGFVNEVVPAAELLDAAQRWAGLILECAPLSIRASKEAVLRGLDEANLEQAMAQQLDSVAAMYRSADFVEGPKAFAEKRKPNWTAASETGDRMEAEWQRVCVSETA